MSELTTEERGEALGEFIGALIGLVIGFGIPCWIFAKLSLFTIDPTHEYGWFLGGWHGGLWFAKWIYSWFVPSVCYSAPVHTAAYTFFWWVSAICVGYFVLMLILAVVAKGRKAFGS